MFPYTPILADLKCAVTVVTICWSVALTAQSFYMGADLSYVNEMEDCGATFNGLGTDDPYAMFSEKGCNLVRLRLWHTPSWYDMLTTGNRYSDLADVKRSIARARGAGMDVLLNFHLSDSWADPVNQIAPAAWHPILDTLSVLQDSLYAYLYSTLNELAGEGLLPDIVQIGNETNRNILQAPGSQQFWSLTWPRNSLLFNSAISAVRDVAEQHQADIRIALHFGSPNDVGWFVEQFWANGVRDFDIIGFSWYPEFHGGTFAQVGDVVDILRTTYPGKEVMIMETAYPYTTLNADGANNILSFWYPGFFPLSATTQRDWLIALTQEMINHQASGVLYWEPAWVSTSCATQWAVGSHWDNATFFDHSHTLHQPGGIDWMQHPYTGLNSTLEPNRWQGITAHWEAGSIVLRCTAAGCLEDVRHCQISRPDGSVILRSQSGSWQANGEEISFRAPAIAPGIYLISLSRADGVHTIPIVAGDMK